MSKKKKIVLSVVLLIFVIVVIVALSLYLYFKPYLRATQTVKELIANNYSYDIECYIEGITLGEGEYGEYTVYVEGEKYDDQLRSYVYSKENAYLEIFTNTEGYIIFNLRPFFQFISNQVEEKLDINVGELVLDIEDTYISMKDIEEILDVDIVSPDDFSHKDKSEEDEDKEDEEETKADKSTKYKLEKVDKPDNINVDYEAENSYFFQLTLLASGTKVVIGVPKTTDDKFYVNMEKDDIKLEMYAEYDVDDTKEIDFPESTFTEEQIQNFKAVYKMWLTGKEVLDKLKMEE